MSINIVGGTGRAMLGKIDYEKMPIKQLTMIVMADIMQTKESSQRQMVEELAAKNALIKRYNDAMAAASRLSEAFSSKAEASDKRPVDGDHKAVTWQTMHDWDEITKGDIVVDGHPKGTILVKDEDGKMVEVKVEGLTFEQRLDLLSANSKPPMSDTAKEMLRGRAQLADIAQSFGMLAGGDWSKGQTYANVAHGDLSKGTLDTIKTKLKTAADALGSENQLDMIKLQRLISEVDASKTGLTSYAKTVGDGEKEIVQKF